MRIRITSLVIFCCILISAQNIFQNTISENNPNTQQKLDKSLASTYILTKYYSQNSFDLKSDLHINLPTERTIKTKLLKTFTYSNKSVSYVYSIENEPKSELVFSKYGNVVTGMYSSVSGEKIIFHQLDHNIFAVSVVSESELINKDNSQPDFILSESSLANKVNADICQPSTAICPATTIDVMVLYTSAARTAWGGVAQSNSFTATAITNFNTALQNSGVTNTTINLVYSGEIDYAESGNISTDLSRLRNSTDGLLDDAHVLRATYGADLCALVTATPTNTCGLGYVNTNPTNYSANSAFTVTLFNCVVSNYSLAHEMGHNMGLKHDWYVDTSSTPCSHHHGYTNQTAITLGTASVSSQRWRTIMAYNNECSDTGFNCARVNRWSNPDETYNAEPTGVPIGNPNPSNEAFGFSRFACVVSEFMPTANLGTFEIKNNDLKDFTVFPNPAKDEINVWIKNDETYTFKVINVSGQIVMTTDKKTINLRGLPSGEYFLSVYTDKNSLVGSKKFIIK